MPTIDVDGTRFTISVLPLPLLSAGEYAKVKLAIHNEFVCYDTIIKNIAKEEIEQLIVALHRFLAGAYGSEYNITLENQGLAVDLYPYTEDGKEMLRSVRRENDCVAAFRFLMRAKNQ